MYYVTRMKAEIPLFRDTLQKGADATAKVVLISATLDTNDKSQESDARKTLVTIRDSLAHARVGVGSFKNSVQALPRLTSVLNRAKRATSAVLQDQMDSIAEGERIVTETIKSLDVILGLNDQRAENWKDVRVGDGIQ